MPYNNHCCTFGSNYILWNSVTVARQTLTLFVGVRIPIPQPNSPEYFGAVLLRGVAQFGSAHRSGRWGRKFESCHLDHNKTPDSWRVRRFVLNSVLAELLEVLVMKKIISVISVLVLCLTIFAGCSSSGADLSEVMDKLNSEFNLSLTKLESVDDLNTYYSIDTADVKQFAAEIDSNNNASKEIVLVEAVDAEAADRVEAALTTRYNSIYSQYASYSAEQLDMVKQCKVTKDGNFVSMIVAENAPDMLNVYYEYVK